MFSSLQRIKKKLNKSFRIWMFPLMIPDDESELQSDLIDWEIEYMGSIDEE
jgi:hypothetical protein